MKRILTVFIICAVLLVSLAACGEKSDEQPPQPAKTEDVTNETSGSVTEPAGTEPAEEPPVTGKVVNTSDIDVDLTKLNSTMVYSEVYSMVNEPDEFLGKTIKVQGAFNASYFDQTGKYYYFIVISDATACCAQGLEFIWSGDHAYPQDYPENGTTVEIVGTFGQYDELGVTYNYILTDSINVL